MKDPAHPKNQEEENLLAEQARLKLEADKESAANTAAENAEAKNEYEQQEAVRQAPKVDVASAVPVSGTAPDKPIEPAKAKRRSLDKDGLDELKYKQSVEPESIQTSDGSVDSGYKVPDHETGLVHVELERRVFSQQTGEKQSVPYVQKFWPQEYADTVERNGFVGYTVTVLHRPEALDQIERAKAARKQQR